MTIFYELIKKDTSLLISGLTLIKEIEKYRVVTFWGVAGYLASCFTLFSEFAKY